MSEQTFEPWERLAIWEVYGQRCAWGGESITLSEMQIDHLINEKIESLELEKAKKEYGLPVDFKVKSWHNLSPSCSKCNSLKSSNISSSRSEILFLKLMDAARKAPKIESHIKKYESANHKNRIKAMGHAALKKGKLSERDLEETIKDVIAEFRSNNLLTASASASSLPIAKSYAPYILNPTLPP